MIIRWNTLAPPIPYDSEREKCNDRLSKKPNLNPTPETQKGGYRRGALNLFAKHISFTEAGYRKQRR